MNRLAIAAIAALLPAAAACRVTDYESPTDTSTSQPTATYTVPPGTETNLDGYIDHETAVYDVPVLRDEIPPQRIWTLLAGSRITIVCLDERSRQHPGAGVYISWAADKYGYVSAADIEITSRTKNTNERIYLHQVKSC